jgi:hypothetical protein
MSNRITLRGTATLYVPVSALDVIKENKTYLNFFKAPRGIKSGTVVEVEVIPATLEQGLFKISYSFIAGSRECAIVPASHLSGIEIHYSTTEK